MKVEEKGKMPIPMRVKCPKCGSANCETYVKDEDHDHYHKYYECPDCGYDERIVINKQTGIGK